VRPRFTAVVAAAAILATVPVAASAAPPWSPPRDITGASVPVVPAVSFTTAGAGLTAWPSPSGLLGSTFQDNAFAPAAPVAGTGPGFDAFAGGFALYGQARVAVAGRLASARPGRLGGAGAALGTLERGLGTPVRLSNAAASGVAIAANADGFVAVAFTDRHGTHVSERRPGRRFPRPVLVSGERGAGFPAVTLDPRGDALIAWYVRGRVKTRFRSAAGHFERTRDIGPASRGPRISLGMTKRRRTLVAWTSEAVSEGLATGPAVQSIAYGTRGRFARRQVLETFDDRPFTAQAGTG
jgi:hypothetical protein